MKSILVVDDELAIVEVLEIALTVSGFAVETAYDGRAALERLRESRPDVVLADIMMPYVDGVELARRVHETPELASVPVILMSAAQELPPGSNSFHAAFLRKPFDMKTLLATIERVIGPGVHDRKW